MASIIKRIEYLNKIFSGINLNIRSRISDEIDDMFTNESEYKDLYREPTDEDLMITLSVLEEALKEAKKEYRAAKKEFKDGSLDSDDLYEFKKIIDDLVFQIKEIKDSLNG